MSQLASLNFCTLFGVPFHERTLSRLSENRRITADDKYDTKMDTTEQMSTNEADEAVTWYLDVLSKGDMVSESQVLGKHCRTSYFNPCVQTLLSFDQFASGTRFSDTDICTLPCTHVLRTNALFVWGAIERFANNASFSTVRAESELGAWNVIFPFLISQDSFNRQRIFLKGVTLR